jgi:hypothetical protein
MNLWVKSLRQLAVLAVASFFFSCEDEASLIGFKDPKPKFNVRYIEIPLSSSVVLIDSVITDTKPLFVTVNGSKTLSQVVPNNTSVLTGQYTDPVLGTVRAEPFLQLVSGHTAVLDATSVYDSAILELRFNNYGYGFSTPTDFHFTIHEITDDSLNRNTTARSYFSTPPRAFDPTPVGEISFDDIRYYRLRKEYLKTSGADTLLATVKLDDSFGTKLFLSAKTTTDTKAFVNQVKGLTVQPAGGEGILGIWTGNSLSKVTMYYHYSNTSGSIVKSFRTFTFAGWAGKYADPNYTAISVNRGSSELSPISKYYQSFDVPSGLRVIQSGAPVITKLDLTNFYEDFADTVENIIINSAELVISNVESQPGLNPPTGLVFKVMQGDTLANRAVTEDYNEFEYYLRKGSIFHDLKHFVVTNENPAVNAAAAYMTYDSARQRYSTFMTLFSQGLFANKNKDGQINPNRLRELALFPATPSAGATVNRALFNSNNVKLRIYYTKPAQIDP